MDEIDEESSLRTSERVVFCAAIPFTLSVAIVLGFTILGPMSGVGPMGIVFASIICVGATGGALLAALIRWQTKMTALAAGFFGASIGGMIGFIICLTIRLNG